MPILLEASDIDLDTAAVDAVLDLTDSDQAVEVKPYTTSGGKRLEHGRAAAIRAWMWNGTETVLTLSWDTDGRNHDGGRRYISKKHCLCCNDSGFRGRCRRCVRDACQRCRSSTVKSKVIPCFYLRKDDVPSEFQWKFYGDIDCFLQSCLRRGSYGFQTDQDMRLHADSRHHMQYQAHLQSEHASEKSELTILRERLDAITTAAISNPPMLAVAAQEPPTTVSAAVDLHSEDTLMHTSSGILTTEDKKPAPAKQERKKKWGWTPERRQAAKDRHAAKATAV